MDDLLRQLGELLLNALPTVFFFLTVYFGYRVIVHKPLLRVLQERYDKTQGAIERARADVAAAEAKTAEYEQRVREAKLSVFKALEARRQAAADSRTEIVNLAREQASAKLAEAEAAIDRDVQLAKAALKADAEKLSAEVISTVLRPALAQAPAGGAQ